MHLKQCLPSAGQTVLTDDGIVILGHFSGQLMRPIICPKYFSYFKKFLIVAKLGFKKE